MKVDRLKKVLVVVVMVVMSIVAAAQGRVERIIESGKIRVGTTGDYKPFTYYENGEYSGYDIEVARYIAREIGVEVEFVPTTWKTLLEDLEDNKFDIAMGGISRNTGRKLRAELSRPYLTYGKTPIVRTEDASIYKSLADIDKKGVRVGINIGGSNEQFAVANIKNAELIRYENNLDVPMAVKDGDVDVMISETPEAVLYEKIYKELASPMTDTPMTKNQLGYLIPKGEYDVLELINFIMEDMELKGVEEELKSENIG